MDNQLTAQKTLKKRWQEYLAMTVLDLRGLLIEAVSQHEGWEESAIALVDEAIMPVIEENEEWREAALENRKLREALQNIANGTSRHMTIARMALDECWSEYRDNEK